MKLNTEENQGRVGGFVSICIGEFIMGRIVLPELYENTKMLYQYNYVFPQINKTYLIAIGLAAVTSIFMIADNVSDVITGNHHYFGVKILEKFGVCKNYQKIDLGE